jgi:hypothetical protein
MASVNAPPDSLATAWLRSKRLAEQAVSLIAELRETVADSRNLQHAIRLRRALEKLEQAEASRK